jgi:hypothetical protein
VCYGNSTPPFLSYKVPSLLWGKHEVQLAWKSGEESSVESYTRTGKEKKKHCHPLAELCERVRLPWSCLALSFVGSKCWTVYPFPFLLVLLLFLFFLTVVRSLLPLVLLWSEHTKSAAHECRNLLPKFYLTILSRIINLVYFDKIDYLECCENAFFWAAKTKTNYKVYFVTC